MRKILKKNVIEVPVHGLTAAALSDFEGLGRIIEGFDYLAVLFFLAAQLL